MEKEIWYIYTMELYSAIKMRNYKIISFSGKWMKLETIMVMVNKISQGQKVKGLIHSFIMQKQYRKKN